MNINNDLSQINIINYPYKRVNSSIMPKNSDSFIRNNSLKNFDRSVTYPNKNVNNIYSPQQLLNAYSNTDYINSLIDKNENLQKLLKDNGLQEKITPENVVRIPKEHMKNAARTGLQIADKMNLPLSDKQVLEQAIMFHDFGKVLIPDEILNKPGSLTSDEKKIIDLHAEIGYELLSKAGMNEKVLELVKNHHKQGNKDTLGQILSVADIYSALREERSYKASMSEQEALKILDQKAQNGEVSTEVVNALKESLLSLNAV